MNNAIKEFTEIKQIAVLGASRAGNKFGNTIATELKQRGYQVTYIHPQADEIDGQKCFHTLDEAKQQIKSVVICLPPSAAAEAIRDAARAGIQHVWMQQGSTSVQTEMVSKEVGINPVTGKCLLMYAEPVKSFHGWHRAFAKLFGMY